MIYLRYELIPKPQSLKTAEHGGAWGSAWIKTTDIDTAKSITEAQFEQSGWDVVTNETIESVDRTDYLDSQSLEYFDQAMLDGEVYVYDTYPPSQDN